MKVIFDNEEQMEAVFGILGDTYCPLELNLPGDCHQFQGDCAQCWQGAVEMSVEGSP